MNIRQVPDSDGAWADKLLSYIAPEHAEYICEAVANAPSDLYSLNQILGYHLAR